MSTRRPLTPGAWWRRGAALLTATAVLAALAPAAHAAEPGTGSLAGVIRSAAGTPLAGTAELTGDDGFHTSVRTADDGRYIATGLPIDDYTVRFLPDAVSTEEAPFGYTARYFIDAAFAEGAEPVEVLQGDTEGVDAALRPAGRVGGTITRAADAPQAVVDLVPSDMPLPEDPWYTGIALDEVDADGSFTVDAAPGAYTLAVYVATEDGYDIVALRDVTVQSAVQNPDVAIDLSGGLDVTLIRPGGAPVTGMEVAASAGGGVTHYAVTDGAGTARFTGLTPGTYAISVVAVPDGSPFSVLFVRGMPVVSQRTSDLTSELGDPLGEGWRIEGATITDDGEVLLAPGPVSITLPDSVELDSASFVFSGDDEDQPVRGEFVQNADDSWTATFDPGTRVDRLNLGIRQEFDLGLSAQTIVRVARPVVPHADRLTDDTRQGVVAGASVAVGAAATVSGLAPNEWYFAWWFSSPTAGGWLRADASGALTAPVPAGITAGAHALAFVTTDAALAGWTPITVTAATDGGGDGNGGGNGNAALPARLAESGAPAPWPWAFGAMLLIGAGAMALRRRTV
ncbi:carboxypeptidase-like regulatory domain-containing protein [Microbacterium sp. NPDC089189]|uniref:carboxypeptidase-like regulatory domain-containing protein n=1 Tax=Microbacterium sp. NPDC089189 TaxID=3154972 RepID=UPI00341FB9B4